MNFWPKKQNRHFISTAETRLRAKKLGNSNAHVSEKSEKPQYKAFQKLKCGMRKVIKWVKMVKSVFFAQNICFFDFWKNIWKFFYLFLTTKMPEFGSMGHLWIFQSRHFFRLQRLGFVQKLGNSNALFSKKNAKKPPFFWHFGPKRDNFRIFSEKVKTSPSYPFFLFFKTKNQKKCFFKKNLNNTPFFVI